MLEIILPVIGVGGMGLVFGVLLSFASTKFAFKSDPVRESIMEILPGINCGACGYPKCELYADAVIKSQANVGKCVVGGTHVAERMANVLGIDAKAQIRMHARVLCIGGKDKAVDKYIYNGVKDCIIAVKLGGGPKGCRFGCIGLGTCVRVCTFDAIKLNDKGISEINPEKCTSCGICIRVCPKKIIETIPAESKVQVYCKSQEKGKKVIENCKTGCIACGRCVKACRYDAINFNNNLASVDYAKCVNCFDCVKVCPTGSIKASPESI